MHPALVIAAKDLRQRLRDRSAIVLGFVAPLAIAALMSFAFQSTSGYHIDVAVADEDRGELATAFAEMLNSDELAQFVTVRSVATTAAQARAQVNAGEVAAAFVIPAGFTAAAHGAQAVPVTVLGQVDEPVAAQVGRSIAESFVAEFNAVRLSVATAVAGGVPAEELPKLAAAAAARGLPEQVVTAAAGTRPLTSISYFGPAMGIFFALFAVGFTASSYFAELKGGTLDRITAAPVSRRVVLAGKSLATFGYGLASLTTVAVVTTLAFGAYWGPPLAAGALIVAMAVAMVGLTALVISVSRTERQAEAVSSMVTFGLVLLGGNFILISAAPPVLRTLALLTPNGWALRGFTDLATGAGGLAAVTVPVLAMLGFAVACAMLAALLTRRVVAR
jgi:ABC-2 type transport system permease protein